MDDDWEPEGIHPETILGPYEATPFCWWNYPPSLCYQQSPRPGNRTVARVLQCRSTESRASEHENVRCLTPNGADKLPTLILKSEVCGRIALMRNPLFSTGMLDLLYNGANPEFVELGSNWPYADSRLDPVQDADFSVNSDAYEMSFSDLKDAVIGVEATSYLQHMIDDQPAHEPLLAALGGDPIALRHHIENELDKWKAHSMRPVFVFDGQSIVGKDDMALKNARAALVKTQKAWELYSNNHPEEAVKTFGASGAIRVQNLYHILQEVLAERGLEFLIAPFSACAQLAYLDTIDEQFIDGIMGSKELLLYNINDAIINPPSAADWEKGSFHGIVKSDLITKLNVASPEMFSDALLMVGTSFLPPFPPLQVDNIISHQPYTLTDAINLLRTSDRSVTNTCNAFQDILEKRDSNWLGKYRRAKLSVKHCCTVSVDGVVSVRDSDSLTSDNADYLGLQMPSELYHYLSKALIGPRILNCFVHLKWNILPTLDGVISDEYKRLVTKSLVPLKETTAALVSSRIARAIQFKDIEMSFWFDDTLKQTLVHRNMQPQANQKTDSWGVKDADLEAQATATGKLPGSLSFALLALQTPNFPATTIFVAPAKDHVTGIDSKAELQANILWRFLHLRGYINDQHELTNWGKALATTLKSIGPVIKAHKDIHHLEEAAFLAFELLRFDNLNSRRRHTELIGGPLRGSEEDKAHCILIGRTACLLKLRHENLGYTGPLSKNFLAFHSIIKEVRETDRDLLEGVLASLLLNGQGQRPRDDLDGLGRSLPFSKDIDTSLGIAVKTYLDDFLKAEWSAQERQENKAEYIRKYLPHSINFAEDLDVAFKFFDAIYEGVSTLGDEISEADRKVWDSANAYLDKRR
ncbi:XPG domain-containing protein [Diplocarpon rosae]|nr:XPG domain-containing protein [Diplocarpon rosae]